MNHKEHDVILDDKRQKKFLLGLFGVILGCATVSGLIVGLNAPKIQHVQKVNVETKYNIKEEHVNMDYYLESIKDIFDKQLHHEMYATLRQEVNEKLDKLDLTQIHNQMILKNQLQHLQGFINLKIDNKPLYEKVIKLSKYQVANNIKPSDFIVNQVDLYTNTQYTTSYNKMMKWIKMKVDGFEVKENEFMNLYQELTQIVNNIFKIALINHNIITENNPKQVKKLKEILNKHDLNVVNLGMVYNELNQQFSDVNQNEWFVPKE